MSLRTKWRYIAGATIMVVGAAAVVWMLMHPRSPSLPAMPPGAVAAPSKLLDAPAYDLIPTPETVAAASEAVARAVAPAIGRLSQQGRLSLPAPEKLADEVREAISLYIGGTLQDYEQYLTSRRLTPPPRNWERPEQRETFWKERSVALHMARMHASGLSVRPRFVGGRKFIYDDATSVDRAERPGRKPSLANLADSSLNVYEVLLPAEVRLHDGSPFHGRLGLWFTWDPMDRQWVLTTLSLYGRPNDSTYVLMPGF